MAASITHHLRAPDSLYLQEPLIEVCMPGCLTDEMRCEEYSAMQALDEACLKAPDGDKANFILLSHGGGDSNTQFSIRVRFGQVFHLFVSYKTEDEIREQLSSFLSISMDKDDRDASENEYLKRMRRVRSLVAGSRLHCQG